MAETTHLDALVAEMLGDIGKLHDDIKSLKDDALPALIADAEKKFAVSAGLLVAAGNNYEGKLNELTLKISGAAKADVNREAETAKNEALGAVRTEVRKAVDEPTANLVRDLKIATARINGLKGTTLKHAIMAAVVSSVLTASIVLTGSYYLFGNATENTVQATPLKKGK